MKHNVVSANVYFSILHGHVQLGEEKEVKQNTEELNPILEGGERVGLYKEKDTYTQRWMNLQLF